MRKPQKTGQNLDAGIRAEISGKRAGMDLAFIRQLIDTLIEKQVDELELEEAGSRVHIRRGTAGAAMAAGTAAASTAGTAAPAASHSAAPTAAASAAAGAAEAEGLITVHSPIVGTFYSAPSPGAPDFVQPGDRVQAGQVLCIVEAMKLMNEIEAEAAGTIVSRLVTSGQPVEYGQPLFTLRSS